MNWNKALVGAFVVCGSFVAVATQPEPRPAKVPFYTWVREDTFAGFMRDDMVGFERGMQKTRDFLADNPGSPQAVNWLAAGNVYLATRAFAAGDDNKGDALLRDALSSMDKAIAAAPENLALGLHATDGGTLALFASKLPERYSREIWERARKHYAALYKVQGPQIDQMPLHIKGEALAGMAESEFRLGNREAAAVYLNKIVATMPGTGYAQVAETFLKTPDAVTKDNRLACQSCHEPGRFAAWKARQTP